jgi:hypothetical protein
MVISEPASVSRKLKQASSKPVSPVFHCAAVDSCAILRFPFERCSCQFKLEAALKTIISAIPLLLMTLPALAEEAIHAAPKVDADPTALIVCALFLLAMFAGFFAYVVWRGRRDQEKPLD